MDPVSKPYEPTADERSAIENFRARRKQTPQLKVRKKRGKEIVSIDHPDLTSAQAVLLKALGTIEPDFLNGILNQLANTALYKGRVDENRLNFLLSMIKGFDPKDHLETMLATQMAAIHCLTMTFVHRLTNALDTPAQDFAERTLNKLARTFAAQVEALKRHRIASDQKVTVEQVTVKEGGKAIVGNVTHAGPISSGKMEPAQ
jgi:hypothetical protein